MAENVSINLTAQDNLTPTLTTVNQAILAFQQQIAAAGTSLTNLTPILTQAQSQLQRFQQAATGAGAGMQQNLQAYGQAIQAVQTQVTALTQVHGQHQQAAQSTTQAMGALHSAFSLTLPLLTAFGAQLSLRGLVNFTSASISLAAKMQDLNLAFKAIEGSGSAANATLSHLFETSQRLGVNFVQVAEGFKRMDQAARGTALEGQGIRGVFDNVLSGTRVLGVSSQQAQQAIVALEQILTKGKLSAEEYRRQLGNAIPGALKLMADGFGRTTQQLEQMIAQDIIPAQAAVIAFAKAMGDLGSGPQASGVERLSSTFAQLKNETVAWMAAIGSGIGSAIQPFLQGLIQISEQLRTLFGIRPPGQQDLPGANQRGFLGSLLPGPLTPDTLGLPPPGSYGPTELPEPGFISSRYDTLIRQAAARAGIDPALFSRLIKEESSFDPTATGRAVPGQGRARGLGQIMPGTGAEYGLFGSADLFDPEKNLTASAQILRDYTAKIRKDFGDLEDITRIALAAYNAGIGNVEKAIRETIAIGEKVTAGQVIGRLPQPLVTGTYVQHIAGGTPPSARGTAGAAGGPAADPMASMLLQVGAAVDATLKGLPPFQEKMDALNASGMNFAGVLGKDITEGADALVKKFTEAANLLISFPGLLAKMQPQQRELLSLAAQQVAAFQQRVLDETQSGANADKRVRELRDTERLEESIREAAKQDEARQRHERMRRVVEEDPLFSFGLLLTPEQEAMLKEEAKAQHERLQEFAKNLDIFGLNLSPGQEAERAFTKKLQDTLSVLGAPKDERLETRLRAGLPPGMAPTAAQEQLLAAVTAAERANSQAREMERIAQHLARNIQSTFDNLWEQVFTGGVTSFRQLGQVVVQSLQRMFAQLTAQIMSQLLNATAGTTDEKGGWAGVLARGVVGLGTAALGSNAGTAPTPGLEALFGRGGVVTGLGPIRALAGGAVIDRPSYALLGERPGSQEAVIPMVGGSVPVAFTGQQAQQQQPIVIHIVNDYTGAVSPSSLKTGKREIIQHIINDYRSDGPIRRTFRAG